jgi:N-acetylglucosaminyldiphosphoundecaprenol N-acetyl-beta-D-mannosaminyltransferase
MSAPTATTSAPSDVRVDVLGVGISVTTPDDALQQIDAWIGNGDREYVCVTPVSGVMTAQRDPAVLRALNGAGMTVPDGMPMVWSGRYAGASEIERVYGPDLMAAVCGEAQRRGWKSFLYGGREGVADRLRASLERRFPGIEIVGTYSPPFRGLTSAEKEEVAEAIAGSGAQLVWVGLSTPKQDLWMAEMVERVRTPIVMVGVGAAFDVHAGLRTQPPAWLGPLGLFWLYRLLQEPRRLWRRYIVDLPGFVLRIVRRKPFLRNA